jgi:hypothetical protein
MTLISNWKTILKKAYSMYSAYLIVAFSIVLQLLPTVAPHFEISQVTVGLINMVLGGSVVVFRAIDQQLGITPPSV